MGIRDSRGGHRVNGLPSCLGTARGAEWDWSPRVELEARHYELFGDVVRGDFLWEWWVRGSQTARFHLLLKLLTCFFNPLLNNLLNILDAKDLLEPCGAKILGVLIITWEVSSYGALIALGVGGSWNKRWWQGISRHLCPLILSGLRLSKDVDLSDELILDVGLHVCLQNNLLMLMSRLHPCSSTYLWRLASIWRR